MLSQILTDGLRLVQADKPSFLQHRHPVRQGKHFLQPMLGKNHGHAQFPVDFMECGNKIGSGNRIQLCRRFIQEKDFRRQHHDRRQIEQLFLPPGKRAGLLAEQPFDAEIAGHFPHPQSHFLLVHSQIFKTECQFAGNLIGHDLHFRILKNKSDFRRGTVVLQFLQSPSLKEDFALFCAIGRQLLFQQSQKSGFSTAGLSAEHQKFAGMNRKRQVGKSLLLLGRIGKA